MVPEACTDLAVLVDQVPEATVPALSPLPAESSEVIQVPLACPEDLTEDRDAE